MATNEPERCAYCGRILDESTKKTDDHVFPKNLFPMSRRSGWEPIMVPACENCNSGWSDDEEHFRNVVNASGDFTPAAEELFLDKIKRSFERAESQGRIRDLLSMSERVEVDGKIRLKIYPARDPRVLNVIRKFVVGLCHHHGIATALSRRRIWVDVLRFSVPGEWLAKLQYEQRVADVVEYWYGVDTEPGLHSVWILRFYGRTAFVAVVSESENGVFPWEGEEESMRAVVFERYGPPEVLSLREIEMPVIKDDEILVKVYAAAVNPQDWHCVRGIPFLARLMVGGLFKPGHQVLGSDVAGIVEEVGKSTTRFQPGDEVLALSFKHGAFAEYISLPASQVVVRKPPNLSFEEAAAVPMASVMALIGLHDKGRIKPGQKVLINGASGGIGTYAVQIAKAMGAEVTGVCSTRNLELVRSLGTDRVIDYTQEDFTQSVESYDVIFDVVAKRTFAECRRALTPNGIYVTTTISVGLLLQSLWVALTSRLRLKPMLQRPTQADLAAVGEYIEAGAIRVVIDRCYPLAEVPDAIAYIEEGHARGKVVITVAPQEGDSK